MRSRLLSFIRPGIRVLLAVRVMLLLIAPATHAQAQAPGGDWQQFPDSPIARQPVTALLVARDGDVWAGTEERGLVRWDGQMWTTLTTADGLADMRVVSLFEDDGGRLWVATGTGLGYFPGDGGEFRRVGKEGIPALPVAAFAQDSRGGLWLGTPQGLAGWREDGALEVVEPLSGKRILSLAATPDGAVWAATDDGLWTGQPGEWARSPVPGSGAVTRIGADTVGNLYALSGARLWRFDGALWSEIGLPVRQGITAFATAEDRLWAAGPGGVQALQGDLAQSYDAKALAGQSVTNLAIAGDGTVWFGTGAGLALHRPDTVSPVIEAVRVNGHDATASAVTLERNQIEQLGVKMQDAGAPAAFAQIGGLDAAPRPVAGTLSAYKDARLPPGQHTLRIWAVDEAFNRSEVKTVTINVPDLAYLPFGVAIPSEAVGPVLAVISLGLLVATAILAALVWRRTAMQRAAASEAARVRTILERAGNPYEGGLAYDPALRIEQAEDIAKALAGPNGQSVLLLGPLGIGKTTLLRHLAAPAASKKLPAAYLDLAETREEDFFAQAALALYSALTPRMVGERPRLEAQGAAARVPGARTTEPGPAGTMPEYGEREFAADLGRLLAFVRPGAPVDAALLLDHAGFLDTCSGAHRDAMRRLILTATGRTTGLRLVLAAETPPAALEGLTALLLTVQLPPLPAPVLKELLLRRTQGAYEWDEEAARGAIALSAGRPGRLKDIAERAVATARRNGRIRIQRTDVAPVRPAS